MKHNQGIQPQPNSMEQQSEQIYYQWDKDDFFKFNSSEFSTLYNTLEEVVNTPTFQESLMNANNTIKTANLYNLMRQKMDSLVKAGIVKTITKVQRDQLIKESEQQAAINKQTPGEVIKESKN